MEKCKWCNMTFNNKQSLAGHCRIHHNIEWKNELNNRNKFININENGSIKCPLCDFCGYSLSKHLLFKHNLKKEEILEYKNKKYKMQIDKRHNDIIYTCDICCKPFNYKNALQSHMKINHPNDYIKANKNIIKEGFICKCCNNMKKNIYQHVKEKHQEYTWDEYCNKYNHNITQKTYMTESHKKKLSINKIKFYNETERGQQLRKEQSLLWKGDNNYSKNKSQREYLSNITANRFINNSHNTFTDYSRGTYIKFLYNNKTYSVRSFEEFKIIITLLINNRKFEYESKNISYSIDGISKTYILDLEFNNDYIEIKSNLNKLDIKYDYIKKALLKEYKKLYILTYESFCLKYNFNKYTTTYLLKLLNDMYNNNDILEIIQIVNKNKKSKIFKYIINDNVEILKLKNNRIIYKYTNNKKQ